MMSRGKLAAALYPIFQVIVVVVYGAVRGAILGALTITVVGAIIILFTGWAKGINTSTIISFVTANGSGLLIGAKIGFFLGLLFGVGDAFLRVLELVVNRQL